jgi:asparagine synthase (glutamine-hydrolysing)
MVGALGFMSAPGLGRAFRLITAPVMKRLTSPKYAGLLEYGGSYAGAYLLRRSMFMPWELPGFLDGELVRLGWEELRTLSRLEQTAQGIDNAHLRVSALEMEWYMRNQLLQNTDWASMAHSVEVRVPLVDLELLRAVMPLCGNAHSPDKNDMALTPETPLPAAVLNRVKSGFCVPVRSWLLNDENNRGQRGIRDWSMKVYDPYRA